MKFTPLDLPGLVLVEPMVLEDSRGFFYESYREDLFKLGGIQERFVQDNHSRSSRGVLRGLHYQTEPMAQGKLVRVIRGSVFDVAVDIRPDSPAFGRHQAILLSAQNKKMLYVPPGFAHGFCVLEDDTEFLYKTTQFYSPVHERGILWSDPDLGIDWPRFDQDYILSAKDRNYPRLRDAGL
ncbi:MAG: dTDP-4-dehydrorhamnose 3,5-epimerase [Candidatus Omnitrophica bacterium]|nr:dTDP-4-dehydrorhamnose 3,5-epimerase [Candidatus Omnitrophota bacterium]